MKVVIITIGLCVLTASTFGLRCAPCVESESRCPNSAKPEDCPYGIVTDICNCCFVCGQGPGDKCGGFWNVDGKCGTGLECVSPEADMWGFEGLCKAVEGASASEECSTIDPSANIVEPTEGTTTTLKEPLIIRAMKQ
ncbi:venom protein 302-like [Macrobrachium nipponense]|uniref:venom protein 302-like n=1 Tax=Macrobrachium nipponense TaxID=159736 RepID=UPI0030C89E7D